MQPARCGESGLRSVVARRRLRARCETRPRTCRKLYRLERPDSSSAVLNANEVVQVARVAASSASICDGVDGRVEPVWKQLRVAGTWTRDADRP